MLHIPSVIGLRGGGCGGWLGVWGWHLCVIRPQQRLQSDEDVNNRFPLVYYYTAPEKNRKLFYYWACVYLYCHF